METASPSPGLRERKKQKTRDTIIRVALDLFAEQGYEQTTIAEIADAAEVSPRTIFAYFPSKEDIVFCHLPEAQERLAQALRERPDGETALDVLRDFIVGSVSADGNAVLRKRILASDERLRRNERARAAPIEQLMVEAIAQDLHAGADDLRPHIVAAAAAAAFSAVHDRYPAGPPESYSTEQAIAVIDDVMDFLRGGLDALRHPAASGRSGPAGDESL
jgi:AcrR family transcriptional regulator